MGRFRVLVSSESEQFCDCLTTVIGETAIFEVIGKNRSDAALVDATASLRPDIVLWKVDGADPVPIITNLFLSFPFVLPVIVVDDTKRIKIMELLRFGLRGCLPASLFPRQIVQALELIVLTGMLCVPRPGREFFNDNSGTGEQVSEYSLSERELQVLGLLKQSLSNQEMARTLYLSESTVKTHLRSLFRKLGVRNRSEALMLAIQQGLTDRTEVFVGNSK